jgi:opacity protein-like surface antigen
MKRLLLAAVLLTAASSAWAACDATYAMTVNLNGKLKADSKGITWYGLEPDEAVYMHQQAMSITDAASKWQDKAKQGEDKWTFEFVESGCNKGSVLIDGVPRQGAVQIMRKAANVGLGLVDKGEKSGKGHAWGKQ